MIPESIASHNLDLTILKLHDGRVVYQSFDHPTATTSECDSINVAAKGLAERIGGHFGSSF